MVSRAIGYAVAAMLLWGVWSIFASYAVSYTTPTVVVGYTYLIGLLAIIGVQNGEITNLRFSAPIFGLSAGAGLAMSFGTLAYYRAVEGSELSVAPAIAGMYFVVTTVFEIAVLGEPLGFTKGLGIVCACIAVFLLAY